MKSLSTHPLNELALLNPPPEPSLPERVQILVQKFTSRWWEGDTGLPDLGRAYTLRDQLAKEKDLERFLEFLNAEGKNRPKTRDERIAARERILPRAIQFARSAFDLEDRHIRAIQSYGFMEIAEEFANMARKFDPALTQQDIYQASRNVWSMNIMQILLGQPIQMTPAIFAYSMLYPYSDNYLDDPKISAEAKRAFNERFRRRLAGEEVTPPNSQEQVISDLIGQIEGQFDRRRYPQVYESLLAIHRAQSRSVELLHRSGSPYEVDALGICFEKGGTSVLADGYLLLGELTLAQQEFMFHYGVFTQLMDDLEDARQDLQDGIMTIFSQTACAWPLDAITNRTFHVGNQLLAALESFAGPGIEPLKELFRFCLTPLLIGEVGTCEQLYTRPYRRELERHFFFRFSFLNRQRKNLAHRNLSLLNLAEILALPREFRK